ncbi:MAG TPA: ATP-binding protein, partial [Ilumatobacteraceae bacterium]|nr:ATP-binding protein [Ilumatobacteraceae bacterium]
MPTLSDRVERRDRAQFVGRVGELDFFDALLVNETDVSVVYLSGPGGIGKSALLREVARRARTHGYSVAWLEGRDLPPFPEVVSAALADVVDAERPLIIIDSFELVSSLEGHLRHIVMPGLPERAVVIISSRVRPSRSWFEGGWDTVVTARQLEGLSAPEMQQLASNLGVAEWAIADLVQRSEGSPLAVAVAAATGLTGSLADVADRLLGDEVNTDRFRTLSVAALARVTTP